MFERETFKSKHTQKLQVQNVKKGFYDRDTCLWRFTDILKMIYSPTRKHKTTLTDAQSIENKETQDVAVLQPSSLRVIKAAVLWFAIL